MTELIQLERIRKYLPGKTDEEILQMAENLGGLEPLQTLELVMAVNKKIEQMTVLRELENNRNNEDIANRVAQRLIESKENQEPEIPEHIRKVLQIKELTKEMPPMPEKDSDIFSWLDYYHTAHKAGLKMTFPMLAELSNYSKNTFKTEHANYKRERGIK